MGFLDFAPEPPAPSATPVTVTEHVDLSCNPSTDTRDLSSEYDIDIRFSRAHLNGGSGKLNLLKSKLNEDFHFE